RSAWSRRPRGACRGDAPACAPRSSGQGNLWETAGASIRTPWRAPASGKLRGNDANVSWTVKFRPVSGRFVTVRLQLEALQTGGPEPALQRPDARPCPGIDGDVREYLY